MEKNMSLQVRKDGIFNKIARFLKNIFKSKKKDGKITQKDIILESERVKNIIMPTEKKKFKDGLKVEVKTDETLLLQKRFENDEKSADDMSDEQINSLILLYKEQVSALKEKINIRRIELEKSTNN